MIILFEYWRSCWWLVIRRRSILNFILLEDISFFICDLGICWLSWSRIYSVPHDWFLLLQIFNYRDRVIVWVISLISVTILYVRSFMTSYWLTWLISDLGRGYVDAFENSSWLYILPELFYSCMHVITHLEYHDLLKKLDWLYLTSIW